MGKRVVMFPLPFQGHTNPMFELAAALHSNGFSITVLHSELNLPDPATVPYDLVPVRDGLAGKALSDDVTAVFDDINEACKPPFSSLMARWMSSSTEISSEGEGIACLIVDSLLYKIKVAAEELGVPTLVLRTGSAACFNMYLNFQLMFDKGYLPAQDSEMELPIAELPPFRVKDLPRLPGCSMFALKRVIEDMIKEARTSSGIIFNTYDAIEGPELRSIREELGGDVPVYAIGPLNNLSPAPQACGHMFDPDYTCLHWLDTRAPGSVLYVSFGSIASMDERELVEVAWGLARSHQPFLWVVRPGSINGTAGDGDGVKVLPQEFFEEIQGRGMIVRWAPQRAVLRHPAVGGFWTHNGWNSTVEGLSEGVPMICMPYFADQMPNARYVSSVLKVGLALDQKGIERGEVEKAIKRLMAEDEGKEMRDRAKDLKEKAADHGDQIEGSSTSSSSSVAFNELLRYIFGLKLQQ